MFVFLKMLMVENLQFVEDDKKETYPIPPTPENNSLKSKLVPSCIFF